jgi:signal transduction histidine kinase
MKAALAWLASFRLRIVFRTSFLFLALAVVAMAVTVLQEEKQRSYDHYQESFAKTKEQIVARLRHPSGQLALLNPPRAGAVTPLRPMILPFSSLDFDHLYDVRHAVEMAGCLVHYRNHGSLCVAIGHSLWSAGFVYLAGTFASGTLVAHHSSDLALDDTHRVQVEVGLHGKTYRLLAPFERLAGEDRLEGRVTAYQEVDDRENPESLPDPAPTPVKDFRGWLWQETLCLDASQPNCTKKSFFSLRLSLNALRDALAEGRKIQWPPPDLDQFQVRVQVLPPGNGPALFDSNDEGAIPPFSLNDLGALLLPGETLTLRKKDEGPKSDWVRRGEDEVPTQSSPRLTRLIHWLPVDGYGAPLELVDEVVTPLGGFQVLLKGDIRSVNQTLGAVAGRVSWFVGAMLLAIGCAWLVIELGIIHPIGRLTERAKALSRTVQVADGLRIVRRSNGLFWLVKTFSQTPILRPMVQRIRSREAARSARPNGTLEHFDLADLRGGDELGILANCLDDLLQRVKEDAVRERIRAEQEKELWHAVGHEIMSPLQSLLAIHGNPEDPSHRYISRMQQAVRVLYGSASPSEAFQSTAVQVQAIDLAEFLPNVAEHAGIADVRCALVDGPVPVHADEYPLEDVFSHVLKNADRYRRPGTPITLVLETTERTATITIHNVGAPIPDHLIDQIFEYGVSEQPEAGARGNRGQGLFVARTYMAKMGGTISARNVEDGVSFLLTLQRVRSRQAR